MTDPSTNYPEAMVNPTSDEAAKLTAERKRAFEQRLANIERAGKSAQAHFESAARHLAQAAEEIRRASR